MGKKKNHPVKGSYGYYAYEKKRRIAIVAFLFGLCLLIFFTGLIMTGTRKNMFTLFAILGVLPAAKWTVSMIMVLLQKPIDPKAEYTITGTTYLLNGGDGYAMFREADILSSTMLPDNEVVMKYIEENLNGVIPEAYENTQGRICIDGRD